MNLREEIIRRTCPYEHQGCIHDKCPCGYPSPEFVDEIDKHISLFIQWEHLLSC